MNVPNKSYTKDAIVYKDNSSFIERCHGEFDPGSG